METLTDALYAHRAAPAGGVAAARLGALRADRSMTSRLPTSGGTRLAARPTIGGDEVAGLRSELPKVRVDAEDRARSRPPWREADNARRLADEAVATHDAGMIADAEAATFRARRDGPLRTLSGEARSKQRRPNDDALRTVAATEDSSQRRGGARP